MNDKELSVLFGQLLRSHRLRAGLSQKEVSRRLGLATGNQICAYETGGHAMKMPTFFKYAEAIGAYPSEILAEWEKWEV